MSSNLKKLVILLALPVLFLSFTVKMFSADYFLKTEKLTYIGEVKGKSYIKIELEAIDSASSFRDSPDPDVLRYKGAYYESASSTEYALTGEFSLNTRSWKFRGFNSEDQLVFTLTGKQSYDGNIRGAWKNKSGTRTFYLKPAN